MGYQKVSIKCANNRSVQKVNILFNKYTKN